MMQNYPGFMDYIAYQYPLEGERIELLEQILTALAVGRKLEAEQMIYHYGSMIHGGISLRGRFFCGFWGWQNTADVSV